MNQKHSIASLLIVLTCGVAFSQNGNLEISTLIGISMTGDANTNESISEIWPIRKGGPNEEVKTSLFKYSIPSPTFGVAVNKFFKKFPIGLSFQANAFSYKINYKKLLSDYSPTYHEYSKNKTMYYFNIGIGPVFRLNLSPKSTLIASYIYSFEGSTLKNNATFEQFESASGLVHGYKANKYFEEEKGRKIVYNIGINRNINGIFFYSIKVEYYRLHSIFRFERILDDDPTFPLRNGISDGVRGSSHGFAPNRKEILAGLSLSLGIGFKI